MNDMPLEDASAAPASEAPASAAPASEAPASVVDATAPHRDRARFVARAVPVIVALVVFLAVLGLHLVCIPFQGLTDDDDFYAPAGIRYAAWLGELVTSPSTALTQARTDAAFAINHEHPPLAKVVFGVASAVFHDGLGWLGVLDGARAGNALLAALLCATLILWLWRPVGPVGAVAAVLVLLSLPRFFFHSEVATLDVPVAVLIVVTCALFTWAGDRALAGVVVGVVFGLACLTKLNAPFAAIPCALLVLLERWRGFGVTGVRRAPGATDDAINDDDSHELPSLQLPALPPSLWAMALLAPVLFVAGWPWLWHDTGARLGGYVAFHLRHYPIFLFWNGEIWSEPFAPGRAALMMAVITIPALVVGLGLLGSLSAVGALWHLARGTSAPALLAHNRVLGLALLQAVLSVGVVAASNVPRYGGEKLFMPFFPFWCVLAGQGVVVVVNAIRHFIPVDIPADMPADIRADGSGAGRAGRNVALVGRVVVPVVVIALAVLPGVIGSARFFGGFALSYYGELTGGLRGAVARGHERTYYDVADKELAVFLDTRLPRGSKVHVAPNHKEYARTYRWLKKDGVISRNGITLVDREDAADVVVLTHERRWSTYPELRERLRVRPVLHEKRLDGVPLYTVYGRATPATPATPAPATPPQRAR